MVTEGREVWRLEEEQEEEEEEEWEWEWEGEGEGGRLKRESTATRTSVSRPPFCPSASFATQIVPRHSRSHGWRSFDI
ncbi:hypothetical protein E2C01_056414 [Portunus trituberculatus]|uniref:Uncharacterized protein n=1 Tax=Portunus trituberculatus TaxID=210409 RepID=A0A5B7GQJ8_PORTR|nr:hypothetical protein [Portunus trituberculatus]